MERLVIGKILPTCRSPISLARVCKDGRSYCQWRGYVNCLSVNKGGLRLSRCSCLNAKQISREYRAVRIIPPTSSGMLKFNASKHNDLILLVPTHRSYGHRREASSDEGSNANNGNKEDMYLLFALGASLIMLLSSASLLNQFSFPDDKLPEHISWDRFMEEYLKKGRVENVHLYENSIMDKYYEVPLVKLFSNSAPKTASRFSDKYVIVDSPKGTFKRQLDKFENEMGVPTHERIVVERDAKNLLLAENAEFYRYTLGALLLFSLWGLVSLSYFGRRISPEYLKRMSVRFQDMIKQRNQTIEEMKKEAQKQKETTEGKDGDKKPRDGSISDMFREAFFRDERFNIKRGDLIMKNELSMKDVAGLHEPKVEIMEFVDYVKNPARFQVLGAKTPRGALLLGPPGCGKTLLAKALAAECEVPFYFVAASELDDLLVGVGAQRVRTLFKKARASSPCVIYIDELDAIGMRRAATDRSNSSQDKEMTLNQLLAEMDGMQSREGVIILASTNRADMLDKALLRPGRFDRHISIDLPTFKERIEHFDLYLSKLALSSPVSTYSTRLAELTTGMSGADIAYICNEAAISAARQKRKKVKAIDFEYAVERKVAGAAKTTNTLGADEKKVIAYHECGHALAGWLLEHTEALLKVSIVPRTSNVGGFAQYLPSDNNYFSKEYLFDMMCMALGGKVAESIIFNHQSTGAKDDLSRVTQIAYEQIRTYGMSETFGHLSFPSDKNGQKPFSKQVSSVLDLEARQLVAKAYKHTEELLQNNKDKLHKLAAVLIERETISARDVEDLIGPPPFGKKRVVDPLIFYDDELR